MAVKTYRLAPLAEVDLEEIWLYTLRKWSLEQANSYHRELVTTFEALADGRKQGRTVDVRPCYFKCPAGSHMVYFRDRGDRIEIIRILHGRMDANRHL